jgi:iron complex outermembrane receptor protein
MRILLSFFFSFLFTTLTFSQEKSDSIKQLEGIIIKAYDANTIQRKVPAAISIISKTALQSTSAYSLLPAFNNVAGVRMEERSPGSYRLSMRGSLLRSPFGVRNVKIYLNEFMLTDAGGNTYLNLLDVAGIDGAEIIKGPPGSIYGAGTGGAILFTPAFVNKETDKDIQIAVSAGSFGTINENISYQHGSEKFKAKLVQSHFQSDGYRANSRMRKDNLQYFFDHKISDKATVSGFFLLSDLQYRTPGGLTAAQYASNPKQARPATSTLLSAVDQHAGIFNKTGLLGIASQYKFSEKWLNSTSFTSSITGFKNPFITNYEKRNELNLGLRTKFVYENKAGMPFQWNSGAEIQYGNYKIDSSGNLKGISDGKSVIDQVKVKQLFGFTQLNLSPIDFMRIQLGMSLNSFDNDLKRIKGSIFSGSKPLKFNPQLLPRIAIMIDPISSVGFYLQIAKGYSSPTVAEIRPSAGGFYTDLQAEYGWNKEVGLKLNAFKNRLGWAINYFDFRLKDAIVRQVNSAGAEYFVNAGSTIQKGVESELHWVLLNAPSSKGIKKMVISQSTTINDFKFDEYAIGANNFSGKKITGVPSQVFVFSLDADFAKNIYTKFNFNSTGSIPLNDANTFTASRYRLIQIKIGWKKEFKKIDLNYFILIDNLLNENYSLGNDLNAFGSRFFNAAPPRNLQTGLTIGF